VSDDGFFRDITAELDEMLADPAVQETLAEKSAAMSGTWQVVWHQSGGRLVAVVPQLQERRAAWAYDRDFLEEMVRDLIAAAQRLPVGAGKHLKLEWVEAGR
jgi:hypothetical protein